MLLPPRVGKVLRANSQVLALAREVKASGAVQRQRKTGPSSLYPRFNANSSDAVKLQNSPGEPDGRLRKQIFVGTLERQNISAAFIRKALHCTNF